MVTEGNTLRYFDGEELIAELPADSLILGGGAPVYDREYSEPAYLKEIAAYDMDAIPEPKDYVATAKALVNRPNLASKRWVYEQYDSMVGTVNRSTNRPGDAAVVQVKGSNKGLVLSVDCNGRYVEADPRKGCAIAVAEAARNIACVGWHAERHHQLPQFWQTPTTPRSTGSSSVPLRAWAMPVGRSMRRSTGGNVSFYKPDGRCRRYGQAGVSPRPPSVCWA